MAEASISVDLFNPGQVFACLGFLEAADVLCGDAEGGFDWSETEDVKFCLRAAGGENPFEVVLQFLASAKIEAVAPEKWRPKEDPAKEKEPENPKKKAKWENDRKRLEEELSKQKKSETFPNVWPETNSALPVWISDKSNTSTMLGHWADGSSRNNFKLYSGNRSALDIAAAMLSGKHDKPTKNQAIGDLETKGLNQLWKEQRGELIKQPFVVTTPTGGSFNFDPGGAWTAIDAGYSPNDQKHKVALSPVVEVLAAWGMENARPDEFQIRQVRYAAWGIAFPPILARVALFGGITAAPIKRFRFHLDLSGKNKVVTYAEEETNHV